MPKKVSIHPAPRLTVRRILEASPQLEEYEWLRVEIESLQQEVHAK